jgi:nucleoside-triphosphatase THEP1
MVYIVTGPHNSGKTTVLRSLYTMMNRGDGIALVKRLSGETITGYCAERLSNNVRVPFACNIKSIPDDWDECYRYGRFSFSRRGTHYACNILDECLNSRISPIFIDEVGLLELAGSGLTPVRRILVSDSDVYLTIRDRYLKSVIGEFSISDFSIIHG